MLTNISPKTELVYQETLIALQSPDMLNPPEQLFLDLKAVVTRMRECNLIINLILTFDPDLMEATRLSDWLAGEENFKLTEGLRNPLVTECSLKEDIYLISRPGKKAILKTRRLPESVTVLILTRQVPEEELEALLDQQTEMTPLLLCLGREEAPPSSMLQKIMERYAYRTLYLPFSALEGKDFRQIVFPINEKETATQLKDYGLLSYLESILDFYKLYIRQEQTELTEKKASLLIHQNALQQNMIDKYAFNDQVQNIKNQVQFFFSDFEKGVKNNTENALRYKTGSLWAGLDEKIEALEELKQEKMTKKVEFTLPGTFEEDYLSTLYGELYTSCKEDLLALDHLYEAVTSFTETEVKRLKLALVPYYFKHLTETQITRVLDGAIRYDRTYRGEMRSTGFYEYFMAMRRYQMIVLIMASQFGFRDIRRRPEIFIPISVFLLLLGGFLVMRSVKKEKVECQQSELEKARELLRNETKRMFSDLQRDWFNVLTEHLRDQMNSFNQHIEKQLKEGAGKLISDQNEKKVQLSKQSIGIELKEKKKVQLSDLADNLIKSIRQQKEEKKQSILSGYKNLGT